MKRFILLLAIAATSALCSDLSARRKAERIETPASDSRIEYTGRIIKDGAEVSYDWSGVYLRIRFNGPYLAVRCSDSRNSWFNLWVDKEMGPEADRRFSVEAKDTVIVLAEGLGKGEHEVILQKKTEGEQGKITLHSFLTEGEVLQADGRKERHIEFIGDSYTAGFGTESSSKDDPFEAKTENCNLTYAAIAARYFNADYNLVCHSGQGIARNYGGSRSGYNMPDRYSQAFDEDKTLMWDQSKAEFTPDIVVIYLGTNDFSTGEQPSSERFAARYTELLNKIRAAYGEDIPILCMASNCSPYTYDYIREACRTSGLKNISYMGLTRDVYNEDNELGACWHPNYKGQIKVASCAIPYISTLTGWEMEGKAYR